MKVIGWVIMGCWAVFWAYWLVSALRAKRGRIRWRQWTGSRIGILVVLVILSRLHVLRDHAAVPASGGLGLPVAGLAVFLAGLVFAVWARVSIGRNWGMPMTEKADPELVTSGPYSRVRHPIYTGIIAAVTGTALALNLWYLIVAAVLVAFFAYSARTEERYLTRSFPDAYPAYRHATKMLIPYLL